MSIPNTGGLTAERAEALFNLANNGVLTRIDERGRRCEDLYQWGLHPHTAETRSALAADDDAFTATYPSRSRDRRPSPSTRCSPQ